MFSINNKFLNPEADICLNKAAMGEQFSPPNPTLYLMLTLKQTPFSEELRQSLLDALKAFTILEFKFLPLETEDVKFIVELQTSHHPNTILTIIELVFEKNKKQTLNKKSVG